MPVFHYRCTKCEQEVEEIQKAQEPLPERVCSSDGGACAFEALPWFARAKTGPTHRFRGESEGVGGWERQGDLLVRRISGNNTTKYGEGSV